MKSTEILRQIINTTATKEILKQIENEYAQIVLETEDLINDGGSAYLIVSASDGRVLGVGDAYDIGDGALGLYICSPCEWEMYKTHTPNMHEFICDCLYKVSRTVTDLGAVK